MEDREGGAKAGEGQAPTLPEGFVEETIERAVEAARLGVDTLLLSPGVRASVEQLKTWLRAHINDHSVEYETRGVAIWSWGAGGHLLVTGSTQEAQAVYARMGGSRVGLEVVSARKQ